LDADPEELIDHAAKPGVAYDHKASMLQDVEARRQTEIDYLNGGIVRFGQEYAVPTPLNAAIQALVKGGEASWTQSWLRGTSGYARRSSAKGSTRRSSAAPSTRASKAPSPISRVSRSSTATPTSSCRGRVSRRSSSRPRRATSASTATRRSPTRFSPTGRG